MKWRTLPKLYKTYKQGDLRLVTRFAYFPTYIHKSNTTVWLQKYYVLQNLWNYTQRNSWGQMVAQYLKWQNDQLFSSISEVKTFLKEKNAEEQKNIESWNRVFNKYGIKDLY